MILPLNVTVLRYISLICSSRQKQHFCWKAPRVKLKQRSVKNFNFLRQLRASLSIMTENRDFDFRRMSFVSRELRPVTLTVMQIWGKLFVAWALKATGDDKGVGASIFGTDKFSCENVVLRDGEVFWTFSLCESNFA